MLTNEVVQETFLTAWRVASTFDASRDLAPWPYTIARRTAIDTLRRKRRPTTGGQSPEVEVAIDAPAFETTFQQFQVRRALDDLPDGEREVVRLSHLVGLSHPEITDRLGVPVGTVKSRSARAHRRLAAALSHLGLTRSDDS